VPATVVLAEHLGDSSILHLQVDGLTELLNAKQAAGDVPVETGQVLGLQVDSKWTLAFDAAGVLLP
jgi:multiple sugar transport system ATP-binding protein